MPTKLSAHAVKNKDNEHLCDVFIFWGKPPAAPLYYNVTISHYSPLFSPPVGGQRYESLKAHKNVTGIMSKIAIEDVVNNMQIVTHSSDPRKKRKWHPQKNIQK
ncbi:uncharacterized protein LOC142320972 [Lycorma delicatula]|uniref:uncharacterized protein LOC142320972 n=1 Tax=Lycorma delicatula TaxID=130591 RepID=UPI003F517F95